MSVLVQITNIYFKDMSRIQTTKHILREWCERNLDTHTDWVGTRVETVNEMDSIDEFVDKLWNYLEEESDKLD
jgi:hypothetical protein